MRNQFIEDKDKGFIVRKKINEDFLKLFIYTDTPFISSNNLTLNYLPKYNNDHALINSVVYDDGSKVGIGTNSPISKLEVVGENIVGYSNASNSHTGIVVRNNNNASWTIDGRLIVDTVNTPNKVIIGSWTNHPLQIITNNTQRMWVDSWGVSTTGNLSVSGDVIISGSLSALGSITQIDTKMYITSSVSIKNSGSDSALIVNQTGNNDIANFYDSNLIVLSLKDGGNVGIGTSTPNEKLTVVGNLSATGESYFANTILNRTGILKEGGQINFNRAKDNATSFAIDVYSDVSGSADSRLRFIDVMSPGGLERMTLLSGGNLGIGTSTPNEKLTVVGGISATGDISLNTSSRLNLGTSSKTTSIRRDAGFNGIDFIADNLSRMFIGDIGNVGIGTSTPVDKLSVNGPIYIEGGTSQFNPGGVVDSSNLTNTYLTFGPAGSNDDWAYIRQIGGNNAYNLSIDMHDDGDASGLGQSFSIRSIGSSYGSPDPTPLTRFHIDGNGNVGIGTISPQRKLHVNGTIRLEGLPTYSSNSTAIAGGLSTNDVYKTSTGELRIVV